MVGFAEGDNLQSELEMLRRENARLRTLVHTVQHELDSIQRSTSWRVTAPLRIAGHAVDSFRRRRRGNNFRRALDHEAYGTWVQIDDEDRIDETGLRSELSAAPRLSQDQVAHLPLVLIHIPHVVRRSATGVAQAARDDNGYLDQLALPRNLLAVTGACLAIRRTVLTELGGLDARFPVAFNDVDLCLRAVKAGYRVLWTPLVALRHLEAATRGDSNSSARQAGEQQAFALFREVWGERLGQDPYFNANLDLDPPGRLMLIHPRRPA